MAEVRYTGPDDARDVPTPEGQFTFPRLEWVDVPADLARSLARQDEWELRAPKKAAKTRAANEGVTNG